MKDIPENSRKVELKAGKKYSFCTCGASSALPICDNSHRKKNEEEGSNNKSMKIILESDCTLWVSSGNWNSKI
jgi:CDGSH-type Zn-finger protein